MGNKVESTSFEKIIQNIPLYQVKKDQYDQILHRSIAAIVYQEELKPCLYGTGTQISKELILTAAHNIFSQDGLLDKKMLRIYLGVREVAHRQTYYQIQDWRFLTSIKKQSDAKVEYDYALIKLKKNDKIPIVQDQFPKISLPCQCVLNKSPKVALAIFGYPKDPKDPNDKNYQPLDKKGNKFKLSQYGLVGQKAIFEVQKYQIQYTISTLPGQSGCAVTVDDRIIAIHVRKHSKFQYNIGRLITTDLIQNLKKWSQQLQGQSIRISQSSFCSNCLDSMVKKLHQSAILNYQKGKPKEALEQLNQCFLIKKQRKQQVDLVDIYQDMGMIQQSKRQFENAIYYYKQSQKIIKKINGEDSLKYVDTKSKIGSAQYKKKKYKQALQSFKETLSIQLRIKGKRCLDSAFTLKKIGNAYYSLRDYNNALRCYQESREIVSSLKQDSHQSPLLHSIGLIYSKQGLYEKAIDYLNKAFNIYNIFKNNGCIQSAPTVYCLGDVYKNLGYKSEDSQKHFRQALGYYEKALQIYERVRGKDCLDSANTIASMGKIYYNLQRYEQSIQSYKNAIRIYEKYQAKDQDYANAQFSLAEIYYEKKSYEQAATAYLISKEVYQQKGLKDMSIQAQKNLKECYQRRAEANYQRKPFSIIKYEQDQF